MSAYKNMSSISFYTSKPNDEKSRYPESGMYCTSNLPMPEYCWSTIRKALPAFLKYRDKIHKAMHYLFILLNTNGTKYAEDAGRQIHEEAAKSMEQYVDIYYSY